MRTLQVLLLMEVRRAPCEDGQVEETKDRLVGTGDAARALGIDRTTLGRWAAAGIVRPASRTAGGHLRWSLPTLREQLAEHLEVNSRER